MNSSELARLLADTPSQIATWNDQARQLSLLLVPARIEGRVSVELHAMIEGTCSAIYKEIEVCSGTVRRLAQDSPAAAAELAPLEDALRLALLEITELSTELYAVHSGATATKLAIGSS
jgi:hypothetical protein